MRKTKYNWEEIQKSYDAGMSWKDITSFYGVSSAAITAARNAGRFKSRSTSESMKIRGSCEKRKHSVETKHKISVIRQKYLLENPDKVPYVINHSSKKSWPEQLFENALNVNNIKGWVYNYRIGLYAYDFAFIDSKLDVEIDGKTHLSDKVKRIDKRRDMWSMSIGWRVIRFTSDDVKYNINECLLKLKLALE